MVLTLLAGSCDTMGLWCCQFIIKNELAVGCQGARFSQFDLTQIST